MGSDFVDFSTSANLRAKLDVWPPGMPLPADTGELARAALGLTLPDLLSGRGANVTVVRFALDAVSVWHIDSLGPVCIEDFVRAVVRAFEPFAFGAAVIQPLRAPRDVTVRGVHCRAALGDSLVELSGDVLGAHGPIDARRVEQWTLRQGRATEDRGRWIGVPPTVELNFPMLGAAEA